MASVPAQTRAHPRELSAGEVVRRIVAEVKAATISCVRSLRPGPQSPSTCSSASATRSAVASANGAAVICTPIGKPAQVCP